MNKAQQTRFDSLYQQHLSALRRQGKADSTIEAYARAVRRITEFFDICPDRLTEQHLKDYFDSLVRSHSWSTVKIDRNGLQFFYKQVLNKKWVWVDIVKPPIKKVLPDILSIEEVERMINKARELRYQTFLLTIYSMGLRLGEALSLRVGDIDSANMKVHIHQGKGRKDRMVVLPAATLEALRQYWQSHKNPNLIFPAGQNTAMRQSTSIVMDRGGVQKAVKAILKTCRIHKSISTHSFRHCYGAHLVEAGLNLRAIQHEMGHESPQTTALYTQLTQVSHANTDVIINKLVDRLHIRFEAGV
jgi:integrase/recombinase XerD